MVTDEELYGQYLCGDETGLELLIKKYTRMGFFRKIAWRL